MMQIGVCNLTPSHCTVINPTEEHKVLKCPFHDSRLIVFNVTDDDERMIRDMLNDDEIPDQWAEIYFRQLLDEMKRKSSV